MVVSLRSHRSVRKPHMIIVFVTVLVRATLNALHVFFYLVRRSRKDSGQSDGSRGRVVPLMTLPSESCVRKTHQSKKQNVTAKTRSGAYDGERKTRNNATYLLCAQ